MKFKTTTSLSLLLAALPLSQAFATMPIERVSVDTITSPGTLGNPNGDSTQAAVSADGRYIVFESAAADLVSGDTNSGTSSADIFYYDRITQTMSRISVSTGGTEGNGTSVFADMSDDGRYVVFTSTSTNLTGDTYPPTVTDPDGSGQTLQPSQIFLRDTQANTTTLITTTGGTSGSTFAANNVSTKPVISADGRFIAYESHATDILAADTDTDSDIYRYDTQADTTALVSVSTSGTKGNENSEEAAISDNGRYIAFSSDASNIGSVDLVTDVFLRDLNTNTTTAITSGSIGAQGQSDSQQPALSADGRYIVYESFRSDLTNNSDTNSTQDVFLFDRNTNQTTLISKTNAGTAGDGRSGHVAISSDGRFIAFESAASELGGVSDSNGQQDVFVYDRTLNKMRRVSSDARGNPGSELSEKPRISTNGRFVVFSSDSAFVAEDTQSPVLLDIYMADLARDRDFNQDGAADIVWRNTSTGLNWMYQMNGSNIILNKPINTISDQNWQIVGVGDFNGDTISDILWRDESTGWNWVYLMNSNTVTTSTLVNVITDTNWKVKGVGDLDADGKDDIIWRNTVTGNTWAYLMNGTVIKSQGQINSVPAGAWELQATGDFNGDGREDIFWRNTQTGLNWVYLMKGTSIIGNLRVNNANDLDWDVVGAGDFNGDGKEDLLWRNFRTGLNWIYLMSGHIIVSSQGVNQVQNFDWKVQLVNDFSNDSRADIMWRNTATGQNWLYTMSGNTITSSSLIDQNDVSWVVGD